MVGCTVEAKSENKRTRSTIREKERTKHINTAFNLLQKSLPCLPKDSKLPKIKTLRLASRYIAHLQKVLQGDLVISGRNFELRELTLEDFASTALEEMQVRNAYGSRIQEVMTPPQSSADGYTNTFTTSATSSSVSSPGYPMNSTPSPTYPCSENQLQYHCVPYQNMNQGCFYQ